MSNRVRIKPQDIDSSDWGDQPVDRDALRGLGWQRRYSEAGGKRGDFKKETTDENNATITEHYNGDRQDVLLRPPTVSVKAASQG